MKSLRLGFVIGLILASFQATGRLGAQEPAAPLRPVFLRGPISDFTLPSLQGGEVSLSKLKGKNVLLVFPRGKIDDHWCQICHYSYAELAQREKTVGLRQKYDLEILFVLPYDKATVQHWVDIFPDQMAVIAGWKNPPAGANDRQKAFAERVKDMLPESFVISKEDIPTPFPILIDAERRVSKGLGLFTTNWDGSAVDQNIPTVILIDASGIVRFKYLSQFTWDRPNADYLEAVLERLLPEVSETKR
jgi:peroxiredoxin